MLEIHVPSYEYYINEEFVNSKEVTIKLEHSLVAISKWESRFEKPFLTESEKTEEELYFYIKCMVTNPDDMDEYTINSLSTNQLLEIRDYIGSRQTATTVRLKAKKGQKEIMTSEVLYYLMIANNIPFECQYWHINRLVTLINVCQAKNETPKKQSPNEILSKNRALNEARRKARNTSG